MFKGVFGDVEHGVNVGVKGLVPLIPIKGDLVCFVLKYVDRGGGDIERMGVLCKLINAVNHILICGVVDKDVDSAHSGNCLIDELLAIFLLRDIGWVKMAFATILLNQLLRVLGIGLFLGQVVDEALCAFHGVQNGNRTADS